MCLYSKRKTPLVAKRDIKVYKMFYDYGGDNLQTPFLFREMKVGKRYKDTQTIHKQTYNGYKVIQGGMFHAFKYASDAEYSAKYLSGKNVLLKVVVVECIIPKGAKYYNGIDADIASKELIVSKKLSKAEVEKLKKKECVYSVFVEGKEVATEMNYAQAVYRAKWEIADDKDAFCVRAR